jgi:hypothetical protein
MRTIISFNYVLLAFLLHIRISDHTDDGENHILIGLNNAFTFRRKLSVSDLQRSQRSRHAEKLNRHRATRLQRFFRLTSFLS